MKKGILLFKIILLLLHSTSTPKCFSLLASSSKEQIVLFDLVPIYGVNFSDLDQRRQFWDLAHMVFALQGIVNREQPRLYVRFNPDVDQFWWDQMRQPGQWLAKREVIRISAPRELVKYFRPFIKGLVIWDERIPATSNLASSIAGAEDLLPVRYDPREGFLYHLLTSDAELDLKVVINLRGTDSRPFFTGYGEIPGTGMASTGSTKADAYLWLIWHYLKTGKLNPSIMGYYIDAFWLHSWKAAPPDNCNLSNHDYIIAKKGLIFDLNVWDDETPIDDKNQPIGTDYRTLCSILRTAWERTNGKTMIQICGFIPWAYKYTSYHNNSWFAGGKHAEVETEWRYAEIISCFNAYMDADAIALGSMANASFFMHYPIKARYLNPHRPTIDKLQKAHLINWDSTVPKIIFISHYMGDYDSAAWLYRKLPELWKDPFRGLIPLNWAFNPNLAERFPYGMAWARQSAKDLDYFVAGNSGAGYLNPGYLVPPRPHSMLPSGLLAWIEHCKRWYKLWDITLTGFIIDGSARPMSQEVLDAYVEFSPDGIVAQKIGAWGMYKTMPYVRMKGDISGSPEQAATQILNWIKGEKERPAFIVCRSILKTPSWISKVNQFVSEKLSENERMEIVDLYTLMTIVKIHALNLSNQQGYLYTNSSKAVRIMCKGGLSPVQISKAAAP